MSIRTVTEKVVLWDSGLNQLISKTEVTVELVTNKGTVLFEQGPLYCSSAQEILEASAILKDRLINSLPGLMKGEVS